jgi:catechol-2,3-dioxygenase
MEEEMAVEKRASTESTKKSDASTPADVPSLFRINVEVGNLEEAAEFYGKLFGLVGRMQAGSRCYFTCGPVTLQVVDVSSVRTPHPAAKALYFVVNDLDAIFERARSLDCLSQEEVHGSPAGKITVQPWGERSFYAFDRWHNPLCFVEAGTIYPG